MDQDELGFMQAICENPDDDGLRLIFADWLDEQGDPRGEFIRVQIALAKLPLSSPRRPALLRREALLLHQYADRWAEPFRGLATGPVFRRGFVDEVKVTARQFLARPKELFAAGPIRRLHLLDAAGRLPTTMASPYLMKLQGLTIYGQHLRANLAQAVADSPYLGQLKSLHLGRNQMGDLAAIRLLAPGNFPQLEELDLSENELTERFGRLWQEPHSSHSTHSSHTTLAPHRLQMPLMRIELGGNALGAAGSLPLALQPGLRRLGLAGNQIGEGRLASLNDASALLAPQSVDLAGNGLGAAGLARILVAQRPMGILELDLSRNDLGDDGVRQLAQAPALLGLRSLNLAGNNLTDLGLQALAQSPILRRLTYLDVSQNPVGDEGLRAIHDSRELRSLTRLVYPGIGVSFAMRISLERKFNPDTADAFPNLSASAGPASGTNLARPSAGSS